MAIFELLILIAILLLLFFGMLNLAAWIANKIKNFNSYGDFK